MYRGFSLLINGGGAKVVSVADHKSHDTPLHRAAMSCTEEHESGITRALLAAGASREAQNHLGMTPLALAAHTGNLHVLREILQDTHGQYVVTVDESSQPDGGDLGDLLLTCTNMAGESLLPGLRMPKSYHARDLQARLAQQIGMQQTKLKLVKPNGDVLTASGADVNAPATGLNGASPLLLAINKGHEGCAVALVEAGADTTGALHALVKLSLKLDTVESVATALIRAGADVMERNGSGRTVMDVSASRTSVRSLLERLAKT